MSSKKKKNKIRKKVESQELKLDQIFKLRYHGAVNIRGIRYQILYSVFRAFDLYNENSGIDYLTLEGIEDLDLRGLHLGNEYIQVKTSEGSWSWGRLKEPIKNFLQVYRANKNCRFVLCVNFPLNKDIARLAQIHFLSSKDKDRVRNKFLNLCRQIEASNDEASGLADRLVIVSVPEEQIWKILRPAVLDVFGCGSEAVDIYILALVAKFLDWAKDRKTIRRFDLNSFRATVGETLARETEFQAYGRGMIDRISWAQDGNPEDFLEGKETRPGHIVANVDVKRQAWLDLIDRAFEISKICVLRSPSGQGKSVLLYRYAYDKWPAEGTFVLRFAESPEHVELVFNYIRYLVQIGLPILLLIDNAGWQTRLWPLVAQKCASLGVLVLVTVRNEDWQRFSRESLIAPEIIEPKLNIDEAKDIFNIFKSKGKLHPSVDSPEWAYEKIGKPYLLMEYIYLLTHGRMLEERLRDQLKQFSELKEDFAKINILRRTALADTLGAPVLADKLMKDIKLTSDPQQILQSLSGEYLKLNGGIITGLHWVRSNHLAQILHEGFPNPAVTALETLAAIPSANIATFVANALCSEAFNKEVFLEGLVERAKNGSIDTILAFLEGIFEAGERHFFQSNKNLFDEAYEIVGPSGLFMLGSDLNPLMKPNFIKQMIDILKEKGDHLRKLQELVSQAEKTVRGFDFCCDFLKRINSYIDSNKLFESPGSLGHLLDWCALTEFQLVVWPTIRDNFITYTHIFSFGLYSFCNFAQGLYRYDQDIYEKWFSRNKEEIISYLKLHTYCIELNISNDSLYIEFFVDTESGQSINEQAVSRLKKLRSAIPFCKQYQSQGIWLLPYGLKPSIDETQKNIPKENLHFQSDVEKNIVWLRIVESNYNIDSYYGYENAWYSLRSDALIFVKALSNWLRRILIGKRFNLIDALEGGKLLERLEKAFKYLPEPPPQTPEHLKEILKRGPIKWSSSFRNFFSQVFQYVENKSNYKIGRLAVINFNDALSNLPEMHTAFEKLFEIVTDYFNANRLNESELSNYIMLADLLEAWIIDPPRTLQSDILQYIKDKRDLKRREVLKRIGDAVVPLEKIGIKVILPADIYVRNSIRYLPLGFSVDNPCYLFNELVAVFERIAAIKDVSDFFCLVPIYKGARLFDDGYQISSHQLAEIENGRFKQWETLVPCKFQEKVLSLLPDLPFQPSRKLQIHASVIQLVGGMQLLIRLINKLELLKISRNSFENELHKHHMVKINELRGQYVAAAIKIMDDLAKEFVSQEKDQNYEIVQVFLKTIIDSETNSLVKIVVGSFSEEDIISAVEYLCCKR